MSEILHINEEENWTADYHYLGDNRIQLRHRNKNYVGEIIEVTDERKLLVRINGNDYPIKIQNELDRLIEALGLNVLSKKDGGDVFSPMPGLVLDILVKPGEKVESDQALLILEAMKMENIIKAQGDGIVKEIHIEKGHKIDKGQLLVSIKSEVE